MRGQRVERVTGSTVDWSELDGQQVSLRLLSNGDIAVIIDGGYGTRSQPHAQWMAAEWASDLGIPLESA